MFYLSYFSLLFFFVIKPDDSFALSLAKFFLWLSSESYDFFIYYKKIIYFIVVQYLNFNIYCL